MWLRMLMLPALVPAQSRGWGRRTHPGAASQSQGTLNHWYLILFSFLNCFIKFVFHPISPLRGKLLEGECNVTAFFPTCLQLPVSVLGAQWALDKRCCSTLNTQATPASQLAPETGKIGHLFGKGNRIHQDRVCECWKLTRTEKKERKKENINRLFEKLLCCKDARMSGNG